MHVTMHMSMHKDKDALFKKNKNKIAELESQLKVHTYTHARTHARTPAQGPSTSLCACFSTCLRTCPHAPAQALKNTDTDLECSVGMFDKNVR